MGAIHAEDIGHEGGGHHGHEIEAKVVEETIFVTCAEEEVENGQQGEGHGHVEVPEVPAVVTHRAGEGSAPGGGGRAGEEQAAAGAGGAGRG